MNDRRLLADAPDSLRRAFLIRSVALPLIASGLTPCVSHASLVEEPGRQHRLLEDIAGILIPRTDTPGADAAEVDAANIVLSAIRVGMDGAAPAMIGDVAAALDRNAGGPYLDAPIETRSDAIATLDARSYATSAPRDAAERAWRTIKGLLLLGYYTSEAGASKELDYELVPGRYDPDIPLTPATRAISSDWFAVSFR